MQRLIHSWSECLTFLVTGFAGGAVMGCSLLATSAPPDNIPAAATANFHLAAEAWNTIQRVYVDRATVTPTQLTYGAISGMVTALGDTGQSRFLTPEMRKIEREVTKGTLEGIEAELQFKNDQFVIVAPIDRSPAQRAGLKPGDIILKVNGAPVSGLPMDEVVGRILGPANTPVGLTILTPTTGSTRDLTLARARITLHSVTWHRLPGTTVAHLRIASFSKGVTHDLRNALFEIQHQGLTGLILDRRNDPGGLYDEALDTASQFRTSGDVLLEKDSAGKVTPVPARAGGAAVDIPMVGLVNGGTASASEIVAGALQDAHRATLVGEKTFGTGTLLETFPLSDGSALLLATKEWLTPAGHLIWHRGISPDVVVPNPADISPLVPEAERGLTPAALRSSSDEQLLRALDLLQHQPGRVARVSSAKGHAASISAVRSRATSSGMLSAQVVRSDAQAVETVLPDKATLASFSVSSGQNSPRGVSLPSAIADCSKEANVRP